MGEICSPSHLLMSHDTVCHVSASSIGRHTLIGLIIPQEVLNIRHAPVPLSEFPFELIVLCSIVHHINTFLPLQREGHSDRSAL